MVDAALYDGELVGKPGADGNVVKGTCPMWFPSVVPVVDYANFWLRRGEIFYVGDKLRIGTPSGPVTVEPYDWIVRDEAGDFHVLSPEAFTAAYEPVPEPLLLDCRPASR